MFLQLLILTISLQLVASSKCLPSLLVFTSLLRFTFAVLQKPCQGNFEKFQGSGESRFSGSEKDRYFLKIPKWQHKLVRDYKRGKLVSYFLNYAAKTCLYGLKILENIEIEHVFQSKALFHLSSNLRTSCLSAFKFLFIVVFVFALFLIAFSDILLWITSMIWKAAVGLFFDKYKAKAFEGNSNFKTSPLK